MSKFGLNYRYPAGYAVEVGEQSSYNHRFGGSSWKVIDPQPLEDGPALLLVLDLTDPRLSAMAAKHRYELPVCSYINSDLWVEEQVYRFDEESKTVWLVHKTSNECYTLPEEDRFPTPLPETRIALRELQPAELPLDEDSYWRNTDDFLGGSVVFRVMGSPLWLDAPEEVKCSCGRHMTHIVGIGYENWNGPFHFLDQIPFFLGEAALYAFACPVCPELRVISQPT
ncbi:hypothetical protein KRX52_07560 [Pseudomonas sp. MAP12]|uniref:Uncharacterized protein n=1 Tax=Geopseudomonas aromaticivorans TaxID=2849492 RepID=A0ABS6MVS9_9GAMM|nr:hypothetical protein [Pseudomonas aromaticivorans]MBV2132660.1 hypothetical protein [Pseudomonas aromaticivorans]